MPKEITKDADKVLCTLYKIYLERRKEGLSKEESGSFDEAPVIQEPYFSDTPLSDLEDDLLELRRAGYLYMYTGGSFYLEKESIIHMEGRFKKGLTEVIDTISKFI